LTLQNSHVMKKNYNTTDNQLQTFII